MPFMSGMGFILLYLILNGSEKQVLQRNVQFCCPFKKGGVLGFGEWNGVGGVYGIISFSEK